MMPGTRRNQRWKNFRRRAEYAPEDVYRHRTHGWEYIPIHPFGDEPDVLAKLDMRREDCHKADAWWGIDGDATLIQSIVASVHSSAPGLFATATEHKDQWVYLVAIVDAPFVTRTAFEAAMVRFAEAGFPHAPRFRLRRGDPHVQIFK